MAVMENPIGRRGPVTPQADKDFRGGMMAAAGAYLMWGAFPLLFRMLDGVPPTVVVAHRVVWSLVVVYIILRLNGRLGEVKTALKDKRTVATIFVAAMLLTTNWLVYVWAVSIERVLETSLGYFILPLVNVVLGMVFLGERQNPIQIVAIAIAVIGVSLQAVGIGGMPWISLILAFSFGGYGFLRKTVNVGSAPGLMIETIVLFPIAIAYLAYTFITTGPGAHADPVKLAWLIFTGPATAGALIFFAYGARQLRLTTIGMLQYIAPSLQFLLGVFLFGEPLNNMQLLSFVLIWFSLVVFSVDTLRRSRKRVR